jgi:hypothetical protein
MEHTTSAAFSLPDEIQSPAFYSCPRRFHCAWCNQFFFDSTPDDRKATLFLAVYNTHEIEYANCDHNALLGRAVGTNQKPILP